MSTNGQERLDGEVTASLPSVLLVKEPRGDFTAFKSKEDPYAVALAPYYSTFFLPALAHGLVNVQELESIIQSGSRNRFSGVVLTSQRAVEAWSNAITTLKDIKDRGWSQIPFYVVGPATAASLSRLPEAFVPPPSLLKGHETGNAERLSELIIHDFKGAEQTSIHLPLLYLVGDKRGDTLSSRLSEAGIAVEELCVYHTFPSPTFASDLQAIDTIAGLCRFRWIVFFSPSGAKQTLPLLSAQQKASVKLGAIGPTTRDYLKGIPGSAASAVANEPKPASLLNALLQYDGE